MPPTACPLSVQVLIYKALGVEQPTFGHVSLILAGDKSKLSKRCLPCRLPKCASLDALKAQVETVCPFRRLRCSCLAKVFVLQLTHCAPELEPKPLYGRRATKIINVQSATVQ